MRLHVFQLRESYLLTATSLLVAILTIGFLESIIGGVTQGGIRGNLLLILGELLLLVPTILVLRQRRIALRRIMPTRPFTMSGTLGSLLLTGGMLVLIEVLSRWLTPHFVMPEYLQSLPDQIRWETPLEAALLFTGGVVVAAITEEILFRGVLQQSLLYSYRSHMPALIVTTVIFALFHVQYLFYLPAALELVLLALTLAIIVDRTAILSLGMVSHAIFNLIAFLSLQQSESETVLEPLPVGWLFLALITVLVALLLLYRQPDALKEDVEFIEAPNLEEQD